jgi:hypothetical protein
LFSSFFAKAQWSLDQHQRSVHGNENFITSTNVDANESTSLADVPPLLELTLTCDTADIVNHENMLMDNPSSKIDNDSSTINNFYSYDKEYLEADTGFEVEINCNKATSVFPEHIPGPMNTPAKKVTDDDDPDFDLPYGTYINQPHSVNGKFYLLLID